MALGQTLKQQQQLKLTPQQIQLQKLFQVSSAQFEDRIKQELEENPLLEQSADEDYEENYEEEQSAAEENQQNEENEFDIEEYLPNDEDENFNEKSLQEHSPEINMEAFVPQKIEDSFFNWLTEQLSLLDLAEDEILIAEQIAGSMDEDGYLRRNTNSIVDDLAFKNNFITTAAAVENVIRKIQSLEPAGLAARDLQECLLLQLERLHHNHKQFKTAKKIIKQFYKEFTLKHFGKIKTGLQTSEDNFKEAVDLILKLNPKPGITLGNTNLANKNIIPDFYIYSEAGKLQINLHQNNFPDLQINNRYATLLKNYSNKKKKSSDEKETISFIKSKMESAEWFINAIKTRQETLVNVMYAIAEWQKKFFLSGDESLLLPMRLKDIAEKVNMDISTISRVANSKYVQTEFGTFALKYFFIEALNRDSESTITNKETKRIFKKIIDSENKQHPLNDLELAEKLNEKGFAVSRRTVAKYRELLDIPTARLRKQV